MSTIRVFQILALAAVFAGCGTFHAVREARSAQKAYADRGIGAETQAEKVDLKGCNLAQLVDFALATRPTMVRARLAVEDARIALRQVAADAPLLSSTPWGGLDASASIGRSEASKSGYSLHGKTDGSASGSLSLDILIYDFGRNAAEARALSEEVIAAETSLISTGYTVFEEVAVAYFALLRNEALFEVALTNKAEYAEHLEQAELRKEHGEAKELDVLKAKLDLAKSVQNVVAASNDVVTAGAELMAALGVDAASGDFRTVLGSRDASLSQLFRSLADTSTSASELYGSACTNAPLVQSARAHLRAASHEVDAAVANLYPTLSASVALNWADPLWYWRWGVNGAMSLFTGWRKTAAVERATIALDSAAHGVDSAELELSREIELAVAERDNAVEALAAARSSVRSGKENLDTVREQYLVGDVSRIEFTAAVSGYASSLGDRVRAFYRGQIAEAKLFRVVGRWPEYTEETISEDEK